jgi:alpha-beta hydrolase superfamily lysophospholipase
MKTEEFKLQSSDGLGLFACTWLPDGEMRAMLCLVHGLGEHCGRYLHVARRITAAGFGVLAFDLRGHGKSEGPRGYIPSYDALLDDISLALKECAARSPAKPHFLYGHSLGGNLVLNYALRRKPDVRGVIATSPGLRTAFTPPPVKLALGRIMYPIWPGLILPSGLELKALSRDARVIEAYNADPLVHDRLSVRLGVDLLANGEWALSHAAQLATPLLLMHGDADRLTSAAASREFASHTGELCTLKIWPGGYHEMHNEPEQEQVIETMLGWMETRL